MKKRRGQPEFGNDNVSPASLRSQISFGQGLSYPRLNELQQILNSNFWSVLKYT